MGFGDRPLFRLTIFAPADQANSETGNYPLLDARSDRELPHTFDDRPQQLLSLVVELRA